MANHKCVLLNDLRFSVIHHAVVYINCYVNNFDRVLLTTAYMQLQMHRLDCVSF